MQIEGLEGKKTQDGNENACASQWQQKQSLTTMFYHNLFIVIYILYGLAHHKGLLFPKKKHSFSVRELKAPEKVLGNCIIANL